MWTFKRKNKEPKPAEFKKPAEFNWKQELIKQLQAWRPIGGEFTYLGITCIVTGYSTIDGSITFPIYAVGIKAEYADNNGVIHAIRFSFEESIAIMKNNP